MCKHWAIAAACGVSWGCSITSQSVDSALAATGDAEVGAAAVVPVKTVDLADLADPVSSRNCENLTRPGSRIVVAQRCRPIDEDALADQLGQVRREQDELDRLAREREAQRRGF